MIIENLAEVEARICKACERAGRDRNEVTLIAVSKTKPITMIEEALNTGIIEFGENKVQELSEKYESLSKKIHWHLIGHLQRNKVKYIIDKAYMIHSVDSLRLVFALAGAIQNSGLVELPVGMPFGDLIYDIGGGPRPARSSRPRRSAGPRAGASPSSTSMSRWTTSRWPNWARSWAPAA